MADIVTNQVFTDGERGITAAKMNNIVGGSSIQPAFYTSKPTASSLVSTDTMLALKSGAYVQAPFQTVIDSVSAGINSDTETWGVRQRSVNSLGNGNFEVDQRQCGTVKAVTPGSGGWVDRWNTFISGTVAPTLRVSQQQALSYIAVPGSNFIVTSKIHRITLTTAQASVTGDQALGIWQTVEGPNLRALYGDVHSISILARSSVANLKFGLILQDVPTSRVLAKLCSLGAANTVTLITLPSLPVFPQGVGNFSLSPGAVGYAFYIALAAGPGITVAANDTWQTTSTTWGGAIGQSNFAASAVNSTIDFAFCQHEPGAACSTLMNVPFTDNLDSCTRFYQKSYPYSFTAGTVTGSGCKSFYVPAASLNTGYGNVVFPKIMAKTPTLSFWSPSGVAGDAALVGAGDAPVSGAVNPADSGFNGIAFPASWAAGQIWQAQYTAETGW